MFVSASNIANLYVLVNFPSSKMRLMRRRNASCCSAETLFPVAIGIEAA
jgi:hypothetical protein